MTTDPAVKAAERLVPYKERDWLSREENERKYRENVDEVAAIIRRHYAALTDERDALLRRAVAACSHLLYSQYFGYERRDPCGLEMQLRAVLHDAARLGITGDAK